MHLHILGICGTFMGSLALLARDLGHTVTGFGSKRLSSHVHPARKCRHYLNARL